MIFSGCWSDKESSCAYELVGLATNVYILSWTNPAWCFSNVFISPHVAWSESIKPGNWQATIPRSMHRFYFGTWFPKCVPCTRAARARFFWNNSQEAYSWLFWRWPTWLVEIIKRSRLKIPEWVFEHQSDWHRTPPVVFFFIPKGGRGGNLFVSEFVLQLHDGTTEGLWQLRKSAYLKCGLYHNIGIGMCGWWLLNMNRRICLTESAYFWCKSWNLSTPPVFRLTSDLAAAMESWGWILPECSTLVFFDTGTGVL